MLRAIPSSRVKAAAFHPHWPSVQTVALTTHAGEVLLLDASASESSEAHAAPLRTIEVGVAAGKCAAVRAAVWAGPAHVVIGCDDKTLRVVAAGDGSVRPLAIQAPTRDDEAAHCSGAGAGAHAGAAGAHAGAAGAHGGVAGEEAAAHAAAAPIAHDDYVRALDVSSDGALLASCADDGLVKVWRIDAEAATARLVAQSPKQPHYVMSVAFRPGSTAAHWEVAFACLDNTISLWQAGHAAETTLAGHRGGVNCVAFSPTGDRMASAADDGLVKVWDVASRRCLATLSGHSNNVSAVHLVTDTLVISCGEDGTLRGWIVDEAGARAALPAASLTHARSKPWLFQTKQHLKTHDVASVATWLREHTELSEGAIAGVEAHAVTGERVAAVLQGGVPCLVSAGVPEAAAPTVLAALQAFYDACEEEARATGSGSGSAGSKTEEDDAGKLMAPAVDLAAAGHEWGRGWCLATAPAAAAGAMAAAEIDAEAGWAAPAHALDAAGTPRTVVCVGADNGFLLIDLHAWAKGLARGGAGPKEGTKVVRAEETASTEAAGEVGMLHQHAGSRAQGAGGRGAGAALASHL